MTLLILLAALPVGAALQQVLPGLSFLGQAKAPFVLCLALHGALDRSLPLCLTAALAGGLLCDGLEALPLGASVSSFTLLALLVRGQRDRFFIGHAMTRAAFGAAAGLGLVLAMMPWLWAAGLRVPDTDWRWLALKALGTAALGALLLPLTCALMGRLDRLVGAPRADALP